MQEILTIGDKIEVGLSNTSLEKANDNQSRLLDMGRKVYVSQILDFIDEDKMSIAMPMDGSTLVPLHVGTMYELNFYSKNGLYRTVGVVESRHKEGNILSAIIKISPNLKKIQRRQYFRLDYIIDIEYRVITRKEKDILDIMMRNNGSPFPLLQFDEIKTDEWKSAILTDISGGGAKFISDKTHNKNEIIKIKMKLNNKSMPSELELTARICHSIRKADNLSKYEQRVEFIFISEAEREYIIKFIFEKQREKRKKENK